MFGKKLSAARKGKGLTLEQLADMYNKKYDGGMSKGTLSKYENEKQEPMISTVGNLAAILGVSVDYLIDETDNKPDDVELEKDIIIYNRNGKVIKKKISKEKMDLLTSMLDAIPEDDNPEL